jgi:hypothetical protein
MKKILHVILIVVLGFSGTCFGGARYHYDPATGDSSSQGGQTGAEPPPSSQEAPPSAQSPALSSIYAFEVNGTSSTFEGRLSGRWPIMTYNTLSVGMNGIASSKDYWNLSADLLFGNRILEDRVILDLGLKGMWGEAESDNDKESELGAVGFLARVMWDLSEIELNYDTFINLELSGEVCMVPSSMVFEDMESYTEWRTSLGIHLSQDKRSTILLGYRDIRMELTDLTEWEKDDNSFYLGYRLRF